jgi:hypothetical protein
MHDDELLPETYFKLTLKHGETLEHRCKVVVRH